MLSFWRDTITRIRPGTKTERGSTVPDWEHATTKDVSGCSVQPASTSLSEDGRVMALADGLTAYVPKDMQPVSRQILFTAGDRIEYNGKTYTINGDPRQWPSATGGLDHIQLNLMRWSG